LRGYVLDVAVDVRVGSPTLVGTQSADFFYKCDEFYSPADEIVVRWNDPALAIEWRVSSPTVSYRDGAGPISEVFLFMGWADAGFPLPPCALETNREPKRRETR
jgi:dTDP-4-dehydrorhamnose 3,5-epimerase-like enzyme